MKRWWLSLLLMGGISASAQALDTPLQPYKKIPGVSGNLLSVGSDTLAGMTTLWVEDFKALYPNINAQVQASGSSTAPPALTEQTAQFGPMSRPMRLREVEAFERTHGYKPTALRVAIDAIGIFVHQDNPVQGLNFPQLDAIFSATLRCGAEDFVSTWAQLGIDAEWAKRNFQLFGRNSVSGTYGYFKKHALCGGDFKSQVNEQPGSASVVQSVASTLSGIGYSGVGYRVAGVRLLPIAKQGNEFVYPSRENILTGDYPLSRYLYVYVNKHPSKALSPIEAEFIKFIYSAQGQALVEKDGYVSITEEFAKQELAKVGL
ncbi:TPA: phosphate ABC transporter substrate-binding protein PstS family protein [Vibrio vulnificus]|uniref:PstS family phosphate ABC transporter substrate-binding protein n=1 Tax=Vibrio vulnificus TaxID=672 RepID=UPI00057D3C67|nr:phosphate ABC transporter substrate-binding protein PstS family protein [Vibrio vulnificus]EJV9313497.1 phosphate ABC transporter substrate-binding protein PstS family protein [Vibrio vulnificus]PWY31447.1 phosphate ABC transporter substrate-binding protein PstS family protein [Vibrio vulnificus]HAS6233984.1 phosphate ABC transporter substrate-binding protein PstS family protein [Vibrio vulnificus]HAS6280255.1 phosphate ABC transporter substrate-binding protein PstS family protein [Vibrio vu